jgi:hypothetical protein
LSDLPWAKGAFGEQASYCPVSSVAQTAPVLRKFYDQAPTLPKPPLPLTWDDVAKKLVALYERIASTSR